MRMEYTAYAKSDEERYQMIKEDILTDYPRIGDLAYEEAKLEVPFGRVNEDYMDFADYENSVNRLICIIKVLDGKSEYRDEFKKAVNDITKEYEYWRAAFPYANPEDNNVYLVMQSLIRHSQDKSQPILTFKDINEQRRIEREEERRRQEEIRNHTMRYDYTAYAKSDEERYDMIAKDILREYPNLKELAYEAAKMETPFGRVHEDYWGFADAENQVNRLIDIVILTEGKKGLEAEYDKACKSLELYLEVWRDGFTYANPEDQEVYFIGEAYGRHKNDPSVPLITFKEAKELSKQAYDAKRKRS
jgi:hypothetical protein